VDISGLITEFRIRGLDQRKMEAALKCLVFVQSVQDLTNTEGGGVLAKDVLDAYPLEVTQVASELYLEKMNMWGLELFKVRWGFDSAARSASRMLWDSARSRWEEFASGLDRRCLGLMLSPSYEEGRVVESWKNRKAVEWVGPEVEGLDKRLISTISEVVRVGYSLDLAFGFSSFGQHGVDGRWTLLHQSAYDSLKEKAEIPSRSLRTGIGLWRFFSRYDPAESEIVKLMKECELTLDDVKAQVNMFCHMGLTTRYRESQYPPYLVIEKMKKGYEDAIEALIEPTKRWVSRRDLPAAQLRPGKTSQQGIAARPRLES